MAGKKENIKALFSNTRTRVIILFTAILLVASVMIGFFKIRAFNQDNVVSSANVKKVPTNIKSIPGSLNQTAQYATLQNKQNIDQAESASKSGGSAIPTIIKTQAFGDGVDLIGPQYGEGGEGFVTLSHSNTDGVSKSLWFEKLKTEACSTAAIKEILDKGATLSDLHQECSCCQLKKYGYKFEDLHTVCSCPELKAAGFTAREIKAIPLTVSDLKACGFSACATRSAGVDLAAMKGGGFSDGELKGAGFSDKDISAATGLPAGVSLDDVRAAGCDPKKLAALRAKGVSAASIQRVSSCSLDQLKAAGFSEDGIKAATDLPAGVSVDDVQKAGCDAKKLATLRAQGVTAAAIQRISSCSLAQLKAAGYTNAELGLPAADTTQVADNADLSSMASIPSITGTKKNDVSAAKSDTKKLQDLMAQQQSKALEQRYQAKVKQLSGRMLSAAGQALQGWKNVPTQVFIMSTEKEDKNTKQEAGLASETEAATQAAASPAGTLTNPNSIFIKTGDILFAVLETSVNTDEPGPILATIVSGKLKGSKLIGSFTLPSNADQMVVTFNTLSMPGADTTMSINAYAIDPNTARTALASRVNHHYLMRYGSLFASTFLEGFSSAIQSADTTITIGGTGGTTDTTVQNGINRSMLENALIGLGEVGKAWSETAEKLMNKPTTVELFSGTGMGILFTQDVQIG